MDDTTGHSRPQQASDQLRHTLSVRDVASRLAEAGVPRSERQIKRYCETGFLDATKVPGPTGEQWFVAPAGLPKLIGDLQQWQMQRAGSSGPRPDTSDTVPLNKAQTGNVDTSGSSRPQQAMSGHVPLNETRVGESDMSRYVTRLEHDLERAEDELDTKNKQIEALLERDRETNYLVRGLQQMLAPLLTAGKSGTGPSSAGDREVTDPDLSPPNP